MNALILAAFALLSAAAVASGSIHDLGHYGHGAAHVAIVNPHALSPVGPSGIVTGHGASGPSGTVTGAGAVGPSGIVTGHGPIGPTGPAGHGHGHGHVVVAAAPIVAAPVLAYGVGHAGLAGHGAWGGVGHGVWGGAGHGAWGLGDGAWGGHGHGHHGW